MTTTPEAPGIGIGGDIAGVTDGATDPARVLRLAMRIAVIMLGSGAQTDDVEATILTVANGLYLPGVQAAVTFSTVQISYDASGKHHPMTLLHIVRNRDVHFDQLSTVADLTNRIDRGELGVEAAEQALDELAVRPSPYPVLLQFISPALSAAASTVVFGGNLFEAVATLAIAVLVQAGSILVDRTGLPPFFRIAFGAFASTLLVVLMLAARTPMNGGLVLTGSLLRFLPGYALVSGFRDIIGESIISGSARLAEALLLGAAIAGGTALGLSLGGSLGVQLSIVVAGQADWGVVVAGAAALVAVATYGVRLGVPPSFVWQSAVIGAVGWLLYQTGTPPQGPVDPSVATLASAILIGAFGRFLSMRQRAPAALWVVPAVLPLLPGLLLVQAMLAETDVARVSGLLAAAATAFLIGTGVASGDIAVSLARRLGHRFVTPAVDAVADRVDVMIIGPVQRAVTATVPHMRDAVSDASPAAAPGEVTDEPPDIDATTST